jgi:hypothetical protein
MSMKITSFITVLRPFYRRCVRVKSCTHTWSVRSQLPELQLRHCLSGIQIEHARWLVHFSWGQLIVMTGNRERANDRNIIFRCSYIGYFFLGFYILTSVLFIYIFIFFANDTKEKEHQNTLQSDLYSGALPTRTNKKASCFTMFNAFIELQNSFIGNLRQTNKPLVYDKQYQTKKQYFPCHCRDLLMISLKCFNEAVLSYIKPSTYIEHYRSFSSLNNRKIAVLWFSNI